MMVNVDDIKNDITKQAQPKESMGGQKTDIAKVLSDEVPKKTDSEICDDLYNKIMTYQTTSGRISCIEMFLYEHKNISPVVEEYIYPMICKMYFSENDFSKLDRLLQKIKERQEFASMVKEFYGKMGDATQNISYYQKGGFTEKVKRLTERIREGYMEEGYNKMKIFMVLNSYSYDSLSAAMKNFQYAGLSEVDAGKKVRNMVKEKISNTDGLIEKLRIMEKEVWRFPKEIYSEIYYRLGSRFLENNYSWDAYLCYKDSGYEKEMNDALDKLSDNYWANMMNLAPRYNNNENICNGLLNEGWKRFSSANYLPGLKVLHQADAFRWIEGEKKDNNLVISESFITDYWVAGYMQGSNVALTRLSYLYEKLGNHEGVKEVNKKMLNRNYVGDWEIQEKKRCWVSYKEKIVRRARKELKDKDKISEIENKISVLEEANSSNFDELLEIAKDMNIGYV